jgi:anti-sigma regulatory factor (Ser/Thr protein kinase)
MRELTIEARIDNLNQAMGFVDETLEEAMCPMKAQMQVDVAVEEIFVNVASYAYAPGVGNVTIRMEIQENPRTVVITFIDSGVPYDPVAKADPDVSLSAEERGIGGLGIFMVKKSMDDMVYEYKDGQNILSIKKAI